MNEILTIDEEIEQIKEILIDLRKQTIKFEKRLYKLQNGGN